MIRLWSLFPVVIVLAAQPQASRAAEPFGDLTGRVVFSGEIPARELLVRKGDATVKDAAICAAHDVPDETLVINEMNRGIQHVFVYLRRGIEEDRVHPDLVKPPSAEVEFSKRGCRYHPHALVLRTAQKVRIRSFDKVIHNVHQYFIFNPPISFVVAPDDRKGVALPFTRREWLPAQVRCDIHPWMSAWWLIVDHPYATVTDTNGRFAIPKLPAGEHVFIVWHEKVGYVEKQLMVKVSAGETTDLKDISVAADRFR
jgi:hypothetical protein